MKGKSAKDFQIWLGCITVTIITLFLAVRNWYLSNHDSNIHNNYIDNTGTTWLILFLFILALNINIFNTIKIYSEFAKLKRSDGIFKEHIDNLESAANKKLSIDQDFSLSLIENRLLRRESWVQLFANLLVTLGMIGTVLGLTASMKGLSQAMSSIGLSAASEVTSSNTISGLSDALSGMSSAFITTLAGAVLGGFFLKLLSHSTTNLIEDLLDNIRYKAEVENIPNLQKMIWNRDIQDFSEAHQNLRNFIKSSGTIDGLLHQYTENMTNAANEIKAMADNMRKEVVYYKERPNQLAAQERTLLRLENLLKKIIICLFILLISGFIALIYFGLIK